MGETTLDKHSNNEKTSIPAKEEGPSALTYKGTLAGLKGLISNKLAEGLSQIVQSASKTENVNSQQEGTLKIPIEQIVPAPDQPRQVFDPKALEELAATMRELGQAQAITVRRTGNVYEIISGERRYRAAKLAGFTHLDCLVKDCTPKEGRLLALVENTQRQDLLPIEEAEFLKRVMEDHAGMSLERMAKILGSHKSTLSEKIQLSEIPVELRSQLYSKKGRYFTHRHWRVISRIQDTAILRQTFLQAIEHQLSVAELERMLSAAGVPKAVRKRVAISGGASVDRFYTESDGVIKLRALQFKPNELSAEKREKLIADLEKVLLTLREGTTNSASETATI